MVRGKFIRACVQRCPHRMAPNSLLWLAPVCSSWVWLNSGTARRNPLDYRGKHTEHEYIAEANKQVSRLCLLIIFAAYRGVIWILEQPRSSLLQYHDRMQGIISNFNVWAVEVCLGSYGAATEKPVKLFSNARWVEELVAPHDRGSGSAVAPEDATAVRYLDAAGEVKGLIKLNISFSSHLT